MICRWSQDDDNGLVELAASGMSASQIAKELGVTRNAVIGRASRMGVQIGASRPQAGKKSEKSGIVKRKPAVVKSGGGYRVSARIEIERPDEGAALAFTPICAPVTINQLSDAVCRFPVSTNSPAQMYCGAEPSPRRVYCAYHAAICYQPARDKAAA